MKEESAKHLGVGDGGLFWGFLCFKTKHLLVHCEIQHPVYSDTKFLSQCMSDKSGFTVHFIHFTNLATMFLIVLLVKCSLQEVTMLVGHHPAISPGVDAAGLDVVGDTSLVSWSRPTGDTTLPNANTS